MCLCKMTFPSNIHWRALSTSLLLNCSLPRARSSGMVVRVVCTVASLFVVPVVAVEACLGKAFHLENRGLTCKEESFAPPLLFPNHLLFLELAVGRKCLLWWVLISILYSNIIFATNKYL